MKSISAMAADTVAVVTTASEEQTVKAVAVAQMGVQRRLEWRRSKTNGAEAGSAAVLALPMAAKTSRVTHNPKMGA